MNERCLHTHTPGVGTHCNPVNARGPDWLRGEWNEEPNVDR